MIELGENVKIKKEQITDLNIINNLTSTSIVNPLSANQGRILNEKFSEVVLYNNTLGATSITLAETSENFLTLYVTVKSSDNVYSTIRIDTPNGKKASVCCVYSVNNVCYNKYGIVNVNGTTVKITNQQETALWNGNTTVNTSNNYLKIVKCVGNK